MADAHSGTHQGPSRTALRPATVAVAAGRPDAVPGNPVNPPVTFSSTYHADGRFGYARESVAVWESLEQVVAGLEGGPHGLAYASGMAAASSVLSLVPVGGTVVVPAHAYMGVNEILGDGEQTGRFGQVRRVPADDTQTCVAAFDDADLVWLESPTNPALEVADLPALLAAARTAGAITCVDNTFATSLLQQPLGMGADIVLHSATKYLAGHSDVLCGVVVTDDDRLHEQLFHNRATTGAVIGPMEAFLALRGVRTLAVRVERSVANAGELARRLAQHPGVAQVRYPGLPDDPGHERAAAQMSGFGAIIGLVVAGSAEQAQAVCRNTRLWTHATSLGGVESLMERRRRWATEATTIPESLIRLSVGIEDVDDLWDDLAAALDDAADATPKGGITNARA